MSWHFSLALEAEYSAACSLDGEPFAPWSSTLSAPDDSCSAKVKDTFHRSQFGMMYVPSTEQRGEALLTWFRGASLAKTLALPAEAQASTDRRADCGVRWRGSFLKYDHDTRSWKTAQRSLLGGSEEYSETWPRWGSMRNGECYQREPMAHGTGAIGCGLLPTMSATDYGSNRGGAAGRVGPVRESLQTMARRGRLPTLTCGGNYNRKGLSPTSGDGLATVLGGPLSPSWCEWFMGWPIGWTALEPLETDRFQQWLLAHGRR